MLDLIAPGTNVLLNLSTFLCMSKKEKCIKNVKGDLKTGVPRHNEIVDELARKICKDLDIPFLR